MPLLIFLVLFLVYDTEESTILQSMYAVLLMVFNTILLSQGVDLVLLCLVLIQNFVRDSNISCLPFQNRRATFLEEYILTSHICFGPFWCETWSALVKLVYLVLCIPEDKVRLKALAWCAGSLQPFFRHPNLKHILSTSASSVLQMGGWTRWRDVRAVLCL